MRMVRALARAIVEELEADGKPVHPAEVAELALRGYSESLADAAGRAAVRHELEDFVRALRARTAAS
jgi:hypothetical protein